VTEPTRKGVQDAQYFEDFAAGREYFSGPVIVHDDAILAFARLYDPQPFHTDPEQAAETIFEGLISSGWQALSETFAKSVKEGFLRAGGVSNEGLEDLRWLKPVRPGDAIHLQFNVVETAPDDVDPDRGRVTFDVLALNQDEEVVMSYRLRVIVRRRIARMRQG